MSVTTAKFTCWECRFRKLRFLDTQYETFKISHKKRGGSNIEECKYRFFDEIINLYKLV
jgi:hypothetical protein